MDPVIDPFRSLLLSIANDCSDDDFANMKFLCNGCISEGRLEAIASPQQLFTELIHECFLASDQKKYLASLLFHIGRHDLRNRLLGKEGKNLILFPALRCHLICKICHKRSRIAKKAPNRL